MTNDKVKQDFGAAYSSGDTICDAMSLARRDDGEYKQALARLCYKWFIKGRAAERAEIREKLESEGVRWFAELARSEFMSDNSDSIPDLPIRKSEAMKAAITKILEVI